MNDLMTSNDRMEEDEINLLDYWRVLVKRKLIIGLVVVAAIIVSVIYALMLPPIYASTASILPPQQEGGGAGGIISQLSGGLGGLAGSFLGVQTPASQWMAILKSRTIKETIIQRFGLMKIFEAKTMEGTIMTLDGMVKISKSKEEVISITAEDKDPKRAAALANAFVEELDRVNKGMVTTSGRRMRVFIEKRLNEAKIELTKAEESMKAFQEGNRAVKLDDQSRALSLRPLGL